MCDSLDEFVGRPGSEGLFRDAFNQLLQNLVRYAQSPSAAKKVRITSLRKRVRFLLGYDLTLRNRASSILAQEYPKAIAQVASEDNIPVNSLPETCPWSIQQVLDQNYLPSGLAKA